MQKMVICQETQASRPRRSNQYKCLYSKFSPRDHWVLKVTTEKMKTMGAGNPCW
jgi:hypothetical protein